METAAEPAPLPAETPADAVFRRLARQCEERAAATDPADPDQSAVWQFCRQTAVRMAQWSRHLPPGFLGRINAGHVAAALHNLMLPRTYDTRERTAHRMVYGHLQLLLSELGVQPAGELYVAGALWSFFQGMALSAAAATRKQAGDRPTEEEAEVYAFIIRLRENLISDMSDLLTAAAGVVLNLPLSAIGIPPLGGEEGARPAEEPAAPRAEEPLIVVASG